MAKLTLIKKIVDKDVVNSSNLIMNVLFGGKVPEIYDEEKMYNKGDTVLIQENGTYKVVTITKDKVTGPYNPEYAGDVVFTDLFKDSSVLTQNNMEMHNKQEALSDDLATLVHKLAGLIDDRLVLNTLYRENFKDTTNIQLNIGLHAPGYIQSIQNTGLSFTLKKPIELKIEPKSFKVKHYIEFVGLPSISCQVTFNALDTNPQWFDVNRAILLSDFFEIPEMVKEEGKPYAFNVRIQADCKNNDMVKISDLMVVFV